MDKNYNAEYLVSISKTNSEKSENWEYINKPSKPIFFGLFNSKPRIGWIYAYHCYDDCLHTEDYFYWETNKKNYLLNNDVYQYPTVTMRFTDQQKYTRVFKTDIEANNYYDFINEKYITYKIKHI